MGAPFDRLLTSWKVAAAGARVVGRTIAFAPPDG
jgi:hypothetical protein